MGRAERPLVPTSSDAWELKQTGKPKSDQCHVKPWEYRNTWSHINIKGPVLVHSESKSAILLAITYLP